jgi:hypothetical protein
MADCAKLLSISNIKRGTKPKFADPKKLIMMRSINPNQNQLRRSKMSLIISEKPTCELPKIWGELSRESQNDVIGLLAALALKQIQAELEKGDHDEQNSG